jgi:hypothetical protein
MFFSTPTLVLAALGSGVTQIVTYGLGNFAVLFLMREKGMTLSDVALWYALVVGHRHGRRHLRLGLADRPVHEADEKAYALLPAIRCPWPCRSTSPSSGPRRGRWPWR